MVLLIKTATYKFSSPLDVVVVHWMYTKINQRPRPPLTHSPPIICISIADSGVASTEHPLNQGRYNMSLLVLFLYSFFPCESQFRAGYVTISIEWFVVYCHSFPEGGEGKRFQRDLHEICMPGQ